MQHFSHRRDTKQKKEDSKKTDFRDKNIADFLATKHQKGPQGLTREETDKLRVSSQIALSKPTSFGVFANFNNL